VSNRPGKIDWKKRLKLVNQDQTKEPSQPVVTSPEPPKKELFEFQEVPNQQLEPDLKLDLKCEPQPEPTPIPRSETEPGPGPKLDKPQENRTTVSPEPTVSMPGPQEERLDNLERQICSQKFMGKVALSLAILLLLSLPVMLSKGSGRSGRIIADNFTITDAKGRGHVLVGEHDGQVNMEFRDHSGRRRLSLGLDAAGEPRLIFYDKNQKILTEIIPPLDGQSGIRLLNQSDEPALTIPALSPPVPAVPEPEAIAPLPTPIPQPEQVPMEAPQAEQKSEAKPEADVKAAESEIILASPKGKTYHLPSCPWIKNIPLDKLVKFSSAAEAAEARYYPCRRCRPNHKD
jgi:hypothetical protein